MKGLVADFVAALYARTHPLFANIANKSPSVARDLFNVLYRFHICRIGDGDLRNPDSTKQMRPSQGAGLLECPIDIGTEDAGRSPATDFLALPAKPLAFGNEWYTVAFLVHG